MCERCKIRPHDGWPEHGGLLCQLCWESVTAEEFWKAVSA